MADPRYTANVNDRSTDMPSNARTIPWFAMTPPWNSQGGDPTDPLPDRATAMAVMEPGEAIDYMPVDLDSGLHSRRFCLDTLPEGIGDWMAHCAAVNMAARRADAIEPAPEF